MSQLLNNLNQAQKDAVVNFDTPSLIIAGAGSGKTRVLTARIAYMLEQGIAANRILALTFTNKAAKEMRERIGKIVSGDACYRMWMGTFHSIFLRILKVEAEHLGYPKTFTIYDTANSRNVIKNIIKEMNLSDEHYKTNSIFSRISLAKNNLVTADAYAADSTCTAEDRERRIPEFSEIYKAYAKRCKENGAMDFDDMLLNINILFRDFPEVLAKYQNHFTHILVDEYQDTNYAQYIIVKRLAMVHSRICVVGDDAQSIYSFRGAKIENILRFKKDFPTAMTFKLEQNYRSTKVIVNAANSVIVNNVNRLKKESFSNVDGGELIKVHRTFTDREEASVVTSSIRKRVREGADWNNIAILYRTNIQFRAFEEEFRKHRIPYRIYGGTSFYQRKEIKDLLAYFQLITNCRDEEAFLRTINYPARGIGAVTLGKITTIAQAKDMSLVEAIRSHSTVELDLKGASGSKVKDFVKMIDELSVLRSDVSLYEFGLQVATRSGIIGSLKAVPTTENQSALDNIEELLNTLQLFEEQVKEQQESGSPEDDEVDGIMPQATVEDWLQSAMLLTDMDEGDDKDDSKVTLMTVHASKGLEFDHIYIVGLEENLFPSLMSLDGISGLEEERRLFYVAITRAKLSATLSFAETRYKWGQSVFCSPSRFIAEIDPSYLELDFTLSETSRKATEAKSGRKHYGSKDDDKEGGENKWKEPKKYHHREIQKTPTVEPSERFRSVARRTVDPDAAPVVITESEDGYKVGIKVEHSKFGVGTIEAIEQTSTDLKITVNFVRNGVRSLLSKFAKLTILNNGIIKE